MYCWKIGSSWDGCVFSDSAMSLAAFSLNESVIFPFVSRKAAASDIITAPSSPRFSAHVADTSPGSYTLSGSAVVGAQAAPNASRQIMAVVLNREMFFRITVPPEEIIQRVKVL